MPNLKHILAAGLLAASLAACTTAEEQTVLSNIESSCSSVLAGTTVLVSIASSLAGAAPVAVISNMVGSNSAPICGAIQASAQGVISAITAAGGTATVTVTTTNPQSGMKSAKRMVFKPNGTVIYVGTVSPAL